MSTKTPITTTHEPLLSDEQVWAIVDKWQRSDDTEWDCACNATCDAMDHYEKDRRSNLSRIAELEARLEAIRVAAHRFKDSYGKVVRAGDTVIIEETYRNERHTGKEAVVSWDESNGVYRYLADGMFSPSDFYGVHKFKKIKP